MANEKISPLRQAYREIPLRFYEPKNRREFVYTYGAMGILMSTGYSFLISNILPNQSLVARALSMGVFLFVHHLDEKSTTEYFQAADRARSLGVENSDASDASLFLWGVKTAEDFQKAKKVRFGIKTIGVSWSGVWPEQGFALSTLKILAAMNNRRHTRRYERATEIARSEDE